MGQSPDSASYNNDCIGLPLVQGNADMKNRITVPQRYSSEPTKIADKDTIILSVRAPVGTVGRSDQKVCLGRGVCGIVSEEQEFMYQYLLKHEKSWKSIEQGGTFTAINSDDIKSFKIYIPTKTESTKIADFLSLVDERIEKQRQLVEVLKRYKRGVISRLLNELSDSEQIPLSTLVSSGVVKLGRGNVIPKYSKDEKRIHPVYSSSVQKNGLMGYFDSYMFDQELITWSIDGGGHFFYRKKHKFNVTNVCGIFEVDTKKYNYKFVAECLIEQHARKHFDYQSKAHPSVIIDMYKLPVVPIHIQEKWSELFDLLDTQIMTSEKYLLCLGEFKQGLLQQMFI